MQPVLSAKGWETSSAARAAFRPFPLPAALASSAGRLGQANFQAAEGGVMAKGLAGLSEGGPGSGQHPRLQPRAPVPFLPLSPA